MDHAKQKDRSTCGIWTLWFAKCILSSQHIMHADIAQEGALIAADIMDSTEPIHKLCAKCGEVLFPKDKP